MKVFACRNINEDVRVNSSSGGIFSVFAESILEEKGIIYGVAMTEECYSAEYIRVTSLKDLGRLRGSKYLQAKMGDTYQKVRHDLLGGKKVLFTGTGCQVNGLKGFLQREYKFNLYGCNLSWNTINSFMEEICIASRKKIWKITNC